MSTTPTNPNQAQRAVQAVQQAGTATAEGAGNIFTGATDWFKKTFENTSGWQIGGMVLGGLLAWVIGNAFGNGGLLGMIISAVLVVPMAIAGRDLLSGFGQPTERRSQGPQPTQHSMAPQQQPAYVRQEGRAQNRRPGEYVYRRPAHPPVFQRVTSVEGEIPAQVVAEAREAARFSQPSDLAEGPVPNLREPERGERGLA